LQVIALCCCDSARFIVVFVVCAATFYSAIRAELFEQEQAHPDYSNPLFFTAEKIIKSGKVLICVLSPGWFC